MFPRTLTYTVDGQKWMEGERGAFLSVGETDREEGRVGGGEVEELNRKRLFFAPQEGINARSIKSAHVSVTTTCTRIWSFSKTHHQ